MSEPDIAKLVELPAKAGGIEDPVELGWTALHPLYPA